MARISLKVDGAQVSDDVEPRMLLVQYLREKLGKTGTVVGCDTSNCGACTVHLDGRSVKSCNVLAVQADGHEVTTIEGLADTVDGDLHPGPGGVPGVPRPPVRLLHAGHDHAERRPAQRQPGPDRGGGAARPRGQPLPLHRLPQHRQERPPRREGWCDGMTATQERPALEIGKDRRRKEDQRLITGRTRWTDNIVLPGMLHLAMVRSPFAHANITSIDTEAAKAAPNVVAVFTGSDFGAEMGVCINAWPITPDQKAPTHLAHAERPGRLRRRDRRRRRGPDRRGGPRRRRAGRRRVRRAAGRAGPQGSRGGRQPQRSPRPPRPRHQQERLVGVRLGRGRHRRQRRRGHREGPRRRHRHRARVPPAAADPGVHGAALRGGRPDRGADHDVVGDPDPPHPAVRARRHHRGARVEDPGRRPRRGWRLRRQAAADAGGDDRVRGRAPARQAGEVHRDPQRVAARRPPRPRPVAEAHAVGREGRHRDRPQGRAARRPRLPREPRRRRRPGARRVHVQRDLQVPRLPVQLPDGPHQQDLDRRLPRRRAARGDVRHRAAHGRARRRGRRRPARDPRAELDHARGVPVHHRRGARVRLRQLRGRHREGQGHVRVRRAAGRAASGGATRATGCSWAWASRRSPRCAASRRPASSAASTTAPAAGSTPACGCWPPARSRSSPAPAPTARATRRRSARSSPTGSASRSRTSRCSTATPRSPTRASTPTARARWSSVARRW